MAEATTSGLRWVGRAALALLCFGLLVFAVAPSQRSTEPPPLGPSTQEFVALRDFQDAVPVPDVKAQRDRAAAAVPVRYGLKSNLVTEQVNRLRDAFRLVRPKQRLYLAERERLKRERERWLSRKREVKVLAAARAGTKLAGADLLMEANERVRAIEVALEALQQKHEQALLALRPEFARRLSSNPDLVSTPIFTVLRRQGFDEEVELLLGDVLQVSLTQRIVRDKERLHDDLARGIHDGERLFRRGDLGLLGAIDLDQARQQTARFVNAFVQRKAPSRFDNAEVQEVVRKLARGMIEVTFVRDAGATFAAEKQARAAVRETKLVQFKRGQSLIKRGDMVTPELRARVVRMLDGVEGDKPTYGVWATMMFLALLCALYGAYVFRVTPNLKARPLDVWLIIAIVMIQALTLRGLWELGQLAVDAESGISAVMWALALPYALGPTLMTLFFRSTSATPFAVLCSGMAGLMLFNRPADHQGHELVALVPLASLLLGFAGVFATRRFRARADLARGALIVTVVGALNAVVVALLLAKPSAVVWSWRNAAVVLSGGTSGALSYLLVAALTPLLESAFNRLTDIKLLELTSMNHPALRKLATETPGTFTHSVMVGNLAEAACDAIGANGLLARVGAYYHDVGKTRAPQYFAENQSGDNAHDRLKPRLSALIIRSHVTDGIELLREYGLPEEIVDFVPQHHGTSLVEHFYNRARLEAEGTGEEVHADDFRYPGPKPQSKEAALMMIADTLEAAAKALPDPTEERIQALVQRLIAKKVNDNQLDECDMTLRELAAVERAFTRTLVGMHHTRPVYLPAPRPQEQRTDLIGAARRMRRVSATARMSMKEAMSTTGEEPGLTQPGATPASPTAVVSDQRSGGQSAP